MLITVTCDCGYQFETPTTNAGRLARCTSCDEDLIVPEVDEAAIEWSREEQSSPSAWSENAKTSFKLGLFFFCAIFTGIPAILYGCRALQDIRQGGGRLRGRWLAIAGIVLGLFSCGFTLAYVMPAVRSARESARRERCVHNLKIISIGFHNFHQENDCLPAAAILDKDGKPLLSWRVAILPAMGYRELYERFHLDEPWDSPHNIALLEEMPAIYGCPSDYNRDPCSTGYQVVIGKDTVFTPNFKPLTFADLTDGLSNTLMVGETEHCVPWTKPEDIPFETTTPRHGLGSYHDHGFHLIRADGSVRFAKKGISDGVINSILTRNQGELIPGDHSCY